MQGPAAERKPEILDRLHARDWSTLRQLLGRWEPPEIADLLMEVEKPDRVLLYRALPRDIASEVFVYLGREEQNRLLVELSDEETRELIGSLPPDDRAQLLEELPGQVTRRLLVLLNPHDRLEVRTLLGYPPESVGRLMTPDYVAIRPEWTVERAIEQIRRHGRAAETISRIYVTESGGKLVDDIDVRKLLLAHPETKVEELMDRSFVSLSAFADREEAVRMIKRYDLVALPVVDSDGVLLGIVTVDDVLDVEEAEVTEDFQRVGSVEPFLGSFPEASPRLLYRRRVGWLLLLVVVNIFSGAGIAYFEDTIAATLALVFFLPLLIDSAGNAGSQSATLMIRSLAVGDVELGDWLRLLGKELGIAAALGGTMALGVSVLAVYRGGPEVGLVVSVTMLIVVMVGSLIGVILPLALTRLGFDPATASAPLVTSIADIAGVLVYFSIAAWLLGR
ncbi:MAG: magnesium transporter [Bryobacteraceae bacterium]